MTDHHHVSGRLYAFLIAFISAVGGFLFGCDLAIVGGANVYLREQFHLSDAMFGFTTARPDTQLLNLQAGHVKIVSRFSSGRLATFPQCMHV